MILRPPRATRTDTLFPFTALFRSGLGLSLCSARKWKLCGHWRSPRMAGVRLRLTVDCMDPRHPDVVVSVNTCVQIKVLIHVGSERTIVGMYGKCDASDRKSVV